MAALLPLICYLLIFAAVSAERPDLRDAAILSAIVWACLLDAITEFLGVFHLLAFWWVAGAWLIACLVCIGWIASRHSRSGRFLSNPREFSLPLTRGGLSLLAGMGLLVFLIGLTAIVAPPNTWDVIDYHLPRVVMWISNRSVGFFPTLDYAQLINSPWAEYAMLHAALLWGGDRLVNLVEWGSYAGTIICASLIARELGSDGLGQILAAVAAATIPGSVLEASGAMNTVVVAFWMAACVYYLLVFAKHPGWTALLASAAACGLAILTKGTAYVLLPPMIAACWWLGSRASRRRFIVLIPVFALIVVVLNAPLWYRNLNLTGSPLGSGNTLLEGGQGMQLATGRLSVRGTLGNVVRNLALDVTISGRIDRYAQRAAVRAIKFLGDDPNDPDFIYKTPPEVWVQRFQTNYPSRHEAFEGYPLDLLLAAAACLLSIFAFRRFDRRKLIFALGLIGSFVLLSALIRWQIWGARYQLAIFVLAAALIGAALPSYLGATMTVALGWLLIVVAIPFALSNQLRPLAFAHMSPSLWHTERDGGSIWGKSRAALYFADQHSDLEKSYVAAANAVRRSGCDEVGIDNSLEHYEYPVMALAGAFGGQRRVRYVGVYNASERYRTPEPPPCAVICFACARVPHKWIEYRDIGGRVSTFGDVAVFWRGGQIANSAEDLMKPDLANENPPALAAQMRSDILALRAFRQHGEDGRAASYGKAISAFPESEAAIDRLFWAVQRPEYDGARVWELTALLRRRVKTGVPARDAGPLIDGAQALQNWVADGPRAAKILADFAPPRSPRRAAAERCGSARSEQRFSARSFFAKARFQGAAPHGSPRRPAP